MISDFVCVAPGISRLGEFDRIGEGIGKETGFLRKIVGFVNRYSRLQLGEAQIL
jgi:hypothetical protein